MSGWTASRVLAETASLAVFVGCSGAPGLLLPQPHSGVGGGSSHLGGGSKGGGGGALRAEDAPRGPGVTACGMSSLRLELSLRGRLAALAGRREERDRHFLALRRAYVAQLKAYQLETKVRVGGEEEGGRLRRAAQGVPTQGVRGLRRTCMDKTF